jgi:hypothetical protein
VGVLRNDGGACARSAPDAAPRARTNALRAPFLPQDPETTGYFKATTDGDAQEIAFFATAPKKWCWKFSTDEKKDAGVWKCTTDGGGDFAKTATVLDVTPAPSKFGAGGLPKGQVNLGETDESWGNAWD